MKKTKEEIVTAKEEGFRELPYYCSEGYPTNGYGRKLGTKGAPLPKYKVSEPEAFEWMSQKLVNLRASLEDILYGLDDVRQAVILSMAYRS